MYKVIREFTDMITGQVYREGDKFPADGVAVSESRIEKLATDKNRQKTPLIEEVKKSSAEALGLNSASLPAEPEKVEQEDAPAKEVKEVKKPRKTAKKN